jgi:hypothetical protein
MARTPTGSINLLPTMAGPNLRFYFPASCIPWRPLPRGTLHTGTRAMRAYLGISTVIGHSQASPETEVCDPSESTGRQPINITGSLILISRQSSLGELAPWGASPYRSRSICAGILALRPNLFY